MPHRIPFGLDRLPRTLPPDDPRLPGVFVGEDKLRLNTEPLPAEAMASAAGDHAARVAAMKQFLRGLCGDYAPRRLRFVDCYIDCMAAHLDAHRDELARALQRYDGVYAPEDWLWSALRPLPRAWLPADAGMVPVDFAFWDGAQAIAIDFSGGQGKAGIAVCHVGPDVLAHDPLALLEVLPDRFRRFWRDQILPVSPFRRAIPRGVVVEEVLSLRGA
ncbi:MAG TPA: hypothetical protein VND19_15065 [Acetobacteraceae bacterium]|nr:hypothetical protein [Acetobacteraceae bacterium]